MKTLLLLLLSTVAFAQSPPADRILGKWVTPNGESKIEIVKCGDAYCGSIKSMKTPKNDEHNPDAALRQRPLLGLQIMKGMKYADADTWSGGTLYGPERGREVTPKLVLASPDSLEIRVSMGVARKTVVWTREK